MSSEQETTKPTASQDEKEDVFATVRFEDSEAEKLVRRAAVELNQSRSQFMAEAAIEKARTVLHLVPVPAKAS